MRGLASEAAIRPGTIVKHAILVAFSAAIVLPLLWVFRVSLTDKLTAYKIPPEIGRLSFENYIEVFTNYDFTRWFSNSLIVALGATVISLPAATMMAYAAARYRTGGSPLLVSVLASQMLPPIVLVLPLFMLFTNALPVEGHVGIIFAHVAINLPFMAWMLVSFFEGESRSLEEAARVDGERRWQAFTRLQRLLPWARARGATLLGRRAYGRWLFREGPCQLPPASGTAIVESRQRWMLSIILVTRSCNRSLANSLRVSLKVGVDSLQSVRNFPVLPSREFSKKAVAIRCLQRQRRA